MAIMRQVKSEQESPTWDYELFAVCTRAISVCSCVPPLIQPCGPGSSACGDLKLRNKNHRQRSMSNVNGGRSYQLADRIVPNPGWIRYPPPPGYSARRASTGFTDAARCAGI